MVESAIIDLQPMRTIMHWADPNRHFSVRPAAETARLPDVEEGLWHGTPCLKAREKSFTRPKDRETLVVLCPLEEKKLFLGAAPEIYFETDHYKGWTAILVRLARIARQELARRLGTAWRITAAKRVAASFDAAARATGPASGRRRW